MKIAFQPVGVFAALLAVALLSAASAATDRPASPFAGTFTDGRLTVELAEASGAFAGTFKLGDKTYPATARPGGRGIEGSFEAGANKLPFSASFDADMLTLVSGKTTYLLKRVVNPLDAPPPVPAPHNPLDAAPPGAPAPATDAGHPGEFSELGSNDAGKALFAKLPAAATPEAAITRAADLLAGAFDGKPTTAGAFADSRTKRRGGATFTAKLKGQDLRGWIFFSLTDDGAAAVSAVYTRADASKPDLDALFAALPANVKMRPHRFPDGSGTVDLPEGWSTETQSLGKPLIIRGPAGQAIREGIIVNVNTPDCQLVKLAQQTYAMSVQNHQRMEAMQAANDARAQQNAANARRMGMAPPPAMARPALPPLPQPPDAERDFPQLIFCRYCATPDEVIKYLEPVLTERARKSGGPYTATDRIIESTPQDPIALIPNSKAGLYYVALTRTDGKEVTRLRSITRIDCYPIGDGKDNWSAGFTGASAPDATFDRDLPLMREIMDSVKIDPDWQQREIKANGEAVRRQGEEAHQRLFKQGREFNAQQAEHFHHFEASMRAQSQARHDSNSDFIEMIGGFRDVYDTKTGTLHSVDLFHADGIVGAMNAAVNDPKQYVQIPLRYER